MPTLPFFRCSVAFKATNQRYPCRLGQRSENCCRFGRNPRCTDLWVRVGNGRPRVADPTFFLGAVWVPAEPTTVLGPLAQPTLRSLISWLKIAHRTEKKVRVGTERPTGADPNPKVGAVPGLGVFFAYSRSPIRPASRTAIGFAVTPTAPLLHRKLDRVGIT